jgi:UDP-N-acetylmuramate dehydrogenase
MFNVQLSFKLNPVTTVQENVSLSPWTTFGVGGPARYFLNAESETEVLDGLDFAASRKLPVFILGGGSNLLVSDHGFPGLVLRVGIQGIVWENNQIRAAAGHDWDAVVAESVDRGMAGIECLSGIPGLVGGTPVQNVGAYGQEVAEVVTSVRVLNRLDGMVVDLSREQCGFEYRTSIFNTSQRDRYIVLSVTYALRQDGQPLVKYPDLVRRFEKHPAPPTLADVRDAVREIRASKGMLIVEGDPDCRSAGSFFKNPIVRETVFTRIQNDVQETIPRYPAGTGKVKLSAAWLIERAGFKKGFAIGPAAVSAKHTLALVNRGGAQAADIVYLAREIRRGVNDKFGMKLVPEPVFVGFTEEF